MSEKRKKSLPISKAKLLKFYKQCGLTFFKKRDVAKESLDTSTREH